MESSSLDRQLGELKAILASLESTVIAYSGGVDSSFLVRVAADTPGLRFVAVTTRSPTTPNDETEDARALASSFGVAHVVLDVDELATPGYAENPPNRCYLCKQTLYPVCRAVARERNLAHVVDGVNLDDLADYRPGLAAAAELAVRHPLAEAGLRKVDVRAISRAYGLPTAEKPASPCLSSRFPYGTRITHDALSRVDAAESILKRLGFRELRVRFIDGAARVEIAAAEHERLSDAGLRTTILAELGELGFIGVSIASEPLRSGSLNDVLVAARR
jgi:uncharacterized protein